MSWSWSLSITVVDTGGSKEGGGGNVGVGGIYIELRLLRIALLEYIGLCIGRRGRIPGGLCLIGFIMVWLYLVPLELLFVNIDGRGNTVSIACCDNPVTILGVGVSLWGGGGGGIVVVIGGGGVLGGLGNRRRRPLRINNGF